MQIEPGYYFFRAVAIDRQSGDTVVKHSGCYWAPDAAVLKEHKSDYIKYLVIEGCKEVRITHIKQPQELGSMHPFGWSI